MLSSEQPATSKESIHLLSVTLTFAAKLLNLPPLREAIAVLVFDPDLHLRVCTAVFLTLASIALLLNCSRTTADDLESPLLVDLHDSALPCAENHFKDLCLGSSDHLWLERRDEELRLVGQVVDQ